MGGAEKVAALHARELTLRGHDVTLLAYHPGNQLSSLLGHSTVRVETVADKGVGRLAGMRALFSGSRFDIVHAYKSRGAVWAGAALTGLRRPAFFVGQHYLDSDPWIVRALTTATCGNPCNPDAIRWVVPSRAAASAVHRSYGAALARIAVLHNPVDLSVLQRLRTSAEAKRELGLEADVPVVSIVANLHPWKNHRMFLRVAARIVQARPETVFLSVGRDQLNGAVQAECEAMGLGSSVRFLGHRSDVPRLLEATDIALITSPDESFCLALAEAGAMGVCSVSTDNGGASDILLDGQTGVLVPRDDDSRMAAEVLSLLTDEQRCLSMGDSARLHVRRMFALETIVDKLETMYSNVI